MISVNEQLRCESDQIAAYLDGELDDLVSASLESHLKGCSACSAELAEQRLLLRTLDSTFSRSSALPLPRDFARVVAARAESDMSGVRDRRENKLAVRLCIGLALAAFALLGIASSKLLLGLARRSLSQIAGVFSLGWNAVYDAVTGLTIISRLVGKGFVPGSLLAGFVAVLLIGGALLLLSRLITNYHRTRLVD
jgi:anti-sigma factor RsiW